MSKKLFIKTYGCQMNIYDSARMQDLLAPFGYDSTEDMQEADIILLNTCHIREKASEKMYSELGRIKKLKDIKLKNNDDIIIIVAGCVAQAEGEEIFTRAPYVNIVVGPQSYHTLPELLAKIARHEKNLIELDFVLEEKFDKLPEYTNFQGLSAGISVQEGCDKFCSFCVVPYTRGAEFSRPIPQIYREVLHTCSKGAKEIFLLGQNVNAYHGVDADNNICNLAGLITHISKINDVQRIRYTTSHPVDMDDDLIKLHGTEKKLMPFLHLPVQSGSDKILKAMNRKHDRAYYLSIIDRLILSCPDIAFSSDFIIGFPGETDEDFADTMELVKKVRYAQCYSFKYSPRPGTPAAIKEQIPEHIKSERLAILQKELSEQQLAFNESCVGRIIPVLFTEKGKLVDQITGKTPYMQSVHILSNHSNDLIGKIIDIKITKALPSSLAGEII